MLILDKELPLSDDRTLLCKLCGELRPLKDTEYCVRCARIAVAKAVTRPMEFMLLLTLNGNVSEAHVCATMYYYML